MSNLSIESSWKKARGFGEEFKSFIAKGNVIDLAVGVIIGGAFGQIVSSLVSDILMPAIGAVSGGLDFTGLVITVGDATISYGNFLQNIIDFLIIAACIFLLVKLLGQVNKKPVPQEVTAKKLESTETEELKVLKEILSQLKKNS